MPRLLMLKGLPGSGKSTIAKGLKDFKRVNMDDLRSMLDDGKWSKGNEKRMQAIRSETISHLLHHGHNVVVDDTNLHPKHLIEMEAIAKEVRFIERCQCSVEVKFVDTPVEECIKRDLKRSKSVGKDVIMKMYNQYLKPEIPVIEHNPALRSCVIVDIDGTVADMTGIRGPYDWHKVHLDKPKKEIIGVVQLLIDAGIEPIFMSGRDGVCRNATNNWIVKHVGYTSGHLHMRPAGDQRKDTIVKRELYDNHILNKYNVHLVLDDRNYVVQMWRDLGLTCLQVADGEF